MGTINGQCRADMPPAVWNVFTSGSMYLNFVKRVESKNMHTAYIPLYQLLILFGTFRYKQLFLSLQKNLNGINIWNWILTLTPRPGGRDYC